MTIKTDTGRDDYNYNYTNTSYTPLPCQTVVYSNAYIGATNTFTLPIDLYTPVPIKTISFKIIWSEEEVKPFDLEAATDSMIDDIIKEQEKAGGYDCEASRNQARRWINCELEKVAQLQWVMDWLRHGFSFSAGESR